MHRQAATIFCRQAGSSVERHLAELRSLDEQIQSGGFEGDLINVRDGWPESWPAVELSLRRGAEVATEKLRPLAEAPLPLQLCWGDAWHNNFLFIGDQVSGLVDFATVRVDTPVADLARLLGSATAEALEWWSPAVDAYAQLRPLGLVELQAAEALHASGTVLSLANWVRWLGVEGRTFTHPQLARDRLRHFTGRLGRLLESSGFAADFKA